MSIKMEEYLDTVTDQIRCVKARELVRDELEDHIQDQAEAYKADGMFEEDAYRRAVRDMGDPVEVGVSLDRIHRPQLSAGVLILIGIISIMSILLHWVLALYSDTVSYPVRNTILSILAGYLLMLLVYRLDYSFLARHGKKAAAAFLTFFFIGSRIRGSQVNGMMMYIDLSVLKIFIPSWICLYVPLYASVLYSCRGEGYKALGKLFLWAALPVLFVFRLPALSLAVVMCLSFVCLTSIAVWKGWYQVSRKKVLALLWSAALLSPAALVAFWYVTGSLSGYRAARIQAFLTGNSEYDYYTNSIARLLQNSCLLGRTEQNMDILTQSLPGFSSDFIFVSLVSAYGILAGVLAAGLLLFLISRVFRISFRQRNQLGMILGCSCGLVFLFQSLLNLAVNLCLMPVTSTTLPFFSSGGSGILVSYILLGLVLSIYRYKNILKEHPQTKKAAVS